MPKPKPFRLQKPEPIQRIIMTSDWRTISATRIIADVLSIPFEEAFKIVDSQNKKNK